MQPLPVGGPPQYIRFLSFQLTGHIVWATVEPLVGNMSPKRVPSCCPELDYGVYSGPGPDINQFWREFKQYNLACFVVSPPPTLALDPLPPEFAQEVKLCRAKCYASQLINNQINWALEKNGLFDNPLIDNSLGDRLFEIYQRKQNITEDQARRLVEFKQHEHNMKLNDLKATQVEAELDIVNATTVDSVLTVFNTAMKSLAAIRMNETVLTKFL